MYYNKDTGIELCTTALRNYRQSIIVKGRQRTGNMCLPSKGAHTRASVARESGWARVPMSQTRPRVECHEPEIYRVIEKDGRDLKPL
jgi:hypothetical protein